MVEIALMPNLMVPSEPRIHDRYLEFEHFERDRCFPAFLIHLLTFLLRMRPFGSMLHLAEVAFVHFERSKEFPFGFKHDACKRSSLWIIKSSWWNGLHEIRFLLLRLVDTFLLLYLFLYNTFCCLIIFTENTKMMRITCVAC